VLLLGSLYTLSRKYQNVQMSKGLDNTLKHFHHPIYQVFWLFAGMAICLLLKKFVKTEEDNTKKKAHYTLLFFPALCDVCATIFDSIGLIYTQVSVHQMLKGFIIFFTGVISYFLFKRQFSKLQCIGMGCVMVGITVVGSSNIHSYNAKFAPHPLLGNLLCLCGQFFLAGMFVYEEKILKEFDIHVFDVVGWEGVWGIFISAIFLTIFFFIPGHDFGSFENPLQASEQAISNNILLASLLVSILVIGPFNYFGTNLTKYSSAMHRCLIDASRMCVVWIISIFCGWEHFNLYQGIGYFIILLGNLFYFEIISLNSLMSNEKENDQNNEKIDKNIINKNHNNNVKDEIEDTEKLINKGK